MEREASRTCNQFAALHASARDRWELEMGTVHVYNFWRTLTHPCMRPRIQADARAYTQDTIPGKQSLICTRGYACIHIVDTDAHMQTRGPVGRPYQLGNRLLEKEVHTLVRSNARTFVCITIPAELFDLRLRDMSYDPQLCRSTTTFVSITTCTRFLLPHIYVGCVLVLQVYGRLHTRTAIKNPRWKSP